MEHQRVRARRALNHYLFKTGPRKFSRSWPIMPSRNSEIPRFDVVKTSDRVLVGFIAIGMLLQLVLLAFVPFGTINPIVFWSSYALWAAFGFLISLRRVGQRKKASQNPILFVLLLFSTLALSNHFSCSSPSILHLEGSSWGLEFMASACLLVGTDNSLPTEKHRLRMTPFLPPRRSKN